MPREGAPWRRRVVLSLLASLCLHLLLLWAYRAWGPASMRQVLRPVRYERLPATAPQPYRPTPPTRLPVGTLEQLRRAAEATVLPETLEAVPERVTPLPTADLELDVAGKTGPPVSSDGVGVAGPAGDDDRLARRLEVLQARRLQVLPSADTTSAAARARRRGEVIVDRAIAAMGGLERLAAVQDMTVRIDVWDSRSQAWAAGPPRYFRQGLAFREDLARGLRQGFDGTVSYRWRYGILLPPPDLRRAAERWDFLSRYRGDGIVVEYLTTTRVRQRAVDVIRVIDTKYHREWSAGFFVDSGLLAFTDESGRRRHILDHREVDGILLPFTIGGASGLRSQRWRTTIDDGLGADFFAVPPERQWETHDMRRILAAYIDTTTASLPQVMLNRFRQVDKSPGIPNWLSEQPVTIELLDVYLRRKLAAAGVLAQEADWDVEAYIDRDYVTATRPPWRQLEIVVTVTRVGDTGAAWSDRIVRRWSLEQYPVIDDVLGDELTGQVVDRLAAALLRLGDRGSP